MKKMPFDFVFFHWFIKLLYRPTQELTTFKIQNKAKRKTSAEQQNSRTSPAQQQNHFYLLIKRLQQKSRMSEQLQQKSIMTEQQNDSIRVAYCRNSRTTSAEEQNISSRLAEWQNNFQTDKKSELYRYLQKIALRLSDRLSV